MRSKLDIAAIKDARKPVVLQEGDIERQAIVVSQIPGVGELPQTLIILLENVIRAASSDEQALRDAQAIFDSAAMGEAGTEIEYHPARVLFQDFTGVPVFVDFAAMRDAVAEQGGDPKLVNPKIPCTLVIDHSVSADVAGRADAAEQNHRMEAERNLERFSFLKWASKSFTNVEIVPPGQGICHQLNLERISQVVATDALAESSPATACFDTVIGTDSHTTTANGIGVLSWGVGGIEAEAAALGQAVSMLVPQVVGLHITGKLPDNVSGMDLALHVAQRLRAANCVGCFVEAYGEGLSSLTATQRASVANMTPEYGATCTYFPVDEQTLEYLALTGRSSQDIAFVRRYYQEQGLFESKHQRRFARIVELDLSAITPSLAGPSRPHDRLELSELPVRFTEALAEHGRSINEYVDVELCDGSVHKLSHGTIALAAVTSCTTATDPAMMVAAGLLACKAHEKGLTSAPWVKTIFAPGSHAVSSLMERAGFYKDLAALGFYNCGWGCMSCIGNSGEIKAELKAHAAELELTSVLSGNRNFEGRISPDVVQNYLCQPALVIAYAIAGTTNIDLTREPVGYADGRPVMLDEIYPQASEIADCLERYVVPELYQTALATNAAWELIECSPSDTFAWDEHSSYIRRAPYFELARAHENFALKDARALLKLGDFVTTDHISPAGSIAQDSPAARYLNAQGVVHSDFNSYGARRGNHEVMQRGTFANVRLTNSLAEGKTGCWTRDFITGELTSVFDASTHYREQGIDLIVLAGKMYGSGSSRDWAAKGPLLQGVRAVIAQSFERIHRSNLVGMGIVPLELAESQSLDELGIDGSELFSSTTLDLHKLKQRVHITATKQDGTCVSFDCIARIDTPTEAAYLRVGGILPHALTQLQ